MGVGRGQEVFQAGKTVGEERRDRTQIPGGLRAGRGSQTMLAGGPVSGQAWLRPQQSFRAHLATRLAPSSPAADLSHTGPALVPSIAPGSRPTLPIAQLT